MGMTRESLIEELRLMLGDKFAKQGTDEQIATAIASAISVQIYDLTPIEDRRLIIDYHMIKRQEVREKRFFVPNSNPYIVPDELETPLYLPCNSIHGYRFYQPVKDAAAAIRSINYSGIQNKVIIHVTLINNHQINYPIDLAQLHLFGRISAMRDAERVQRVIAAELAKTNDIEIADLEVYNPFSKGYDRVL